MLNNFSPYHPLIFAAVFFSIPIFYLLGAFFTPHFQHAWRNIAARTAMGAIVFTVMNAVFHAGLHTMLLPFVFLLPFLFKARPEGLIADLKSITFSQCLIGIATIVIVLLSEMFLSDIREGNNIVIGNWDIAHCSGMGHDFYLIGSETIRFLWNFQDNSAFYHFSDLWFSGFFSNYFGILPYYAYSIVYRAVFLIIIFLLLYSWVVPMMEFKKWLALLLPFFILFMPGLQLFNFGAFTVDDMLWSYSTYLIMAVAFLLFSMIATEKNYFIGLTGIMMVPVLHPALALATPIAVLFMLALKIVSGYSSRPIAVIPLTYLQFMILFLAASSAYLYGVIDGRMYENAAHMFSFNYAGKAILSAIAIMLSAIYLLPFLVGLWFLKFRDTTKPLVIIHTGIFTGMLISFALVFPHMSGDSEQIFSAYALAFLIPAGISGLFIFAGTSHKRLMPVATLLLMICFASGVKAFYRAANGQPIQHAVENLRWFDEEWKRISRMDANEVEKLRSRLANKKLTDVAFIVCNDSSGRFQEAILMSRMPYLRGLLPGTEFHRLNIILADTSNEVTDKHKVHVFRRSTLFHIYSQHNNAATLVEQMENYLKPDYLILDRTDTSLCIPPALAARYTFFDTLGRFILVSEKK